LESLASENFTNILKAASAGPIFFRDKNPKIKTEIRDEIRKTLSYKKSCWKVLAQSVFQKINFTNILRRWNLPNMYGEIYQFSSPFAKHHFPKKRVSSCSEEKAACKLLVKLTPTVNFINIFYANFLCKRLFSSFYQLHVSRKAAEKTYVCKIRA
jgi:hypothetical protein